VLDRRLQVFKKQGRGRLFDARGWSLTGDLLKLREDGQYELIRRARI